MVPKLVPLMRASLRRTISFTPALSSFAGMGRWPHSGIPGAPLGPAFFSTITEFSSTGKFGSSRRASKSRLFWKTTARPRCFIRCGETADCLMTAPSGARFPFRTTTPPWGNRGSLRGLMTSRLKHAARFRFSPMVLPLAVSASKCSSGLISFSTAGTPPA